MGFYGWHTGTCCMLIATTSAAFSLNGQCRSRCFRGIACARTHATLSWSSSLIDWRRYRRGIRMNRDDNDSLSHMLSSPERYARQLGISIEDVRRIQEDHAAASRTLNRRVKEASLDGDGREKHRLICEHRYLHAKHPFVCRKCWCYRPICLCNEAASLPRIRLPSAVKQVILWTHHREWTSVSNSGSMLPLLLDDTKLLMKGLPQHDEELQSILDNFGSGHAIVLWPDNDTSIKQNEETYTVGPEVEHDRVTWQDLQTTLAENDGDCRVTLIVLEGTWRTARRMASKLPTTIQRLSLPPDVLFWSARPSLGDIDDCDETKRIQQSLLRPLRRQEGGSELNLCTAEAVTAALVGLGMSWENGGRILDLVQKKVDQTRRYRGKRMSE